MTLEDEFKPIRGGVDNDPMSSDLQRLAKLIGDAHKPQPIVETDYTEELLAEHPLLVAYKPKARLVRHFGNIIELVYSASYNGQEYLMSISEAEFAIKLAHVTFEYVRKDWHERFTLALGHMLTKDRVKKTK